MEGPCGFLYFKPHIFCQPGLALGDSCRFFHGFHSSQHNLTLYGRAQLRQHDCIHTKTPEPRLLFVKKSIERRQGLFLCAVAPPASSRNFSTPVETAEGPWVSLPGRSTSATRSRSPLPSTLLKSLPCLPRPAGGGSRFCRWFCFGSLLPVAYGLWPILCPAKALPNAVKQSGKI